MEESKTSQRFFQHVVFPFRKVGVIAPYIIRESIGKAVRMKDPSVLLGSIEKKLTKESTSFLIYPSLIELMQEVECLILANPVKETIAIAEELNQNQNQLSKRILIIQMTSLNSEIFAECENLSNNLTEYICTHPILLKDKDFVKEINSAFFDSIPWLIFPHEKNNLESLHTTESFIHFLGGEPVYMQTKTEDRENVLDFLDQWLK
jgi:prephenate dehydrogenase